MENINNNIDSQIRYENDIPKKHILFFNFINSFFTSFFLFIFSFIPLYFYHILDIHHFYLLKIFFIFSIIYFIKSIIDFIFYIQNIKPNSNQDIFQYHFTNTLYIIYYIFIIYANIIFYNTGFNNIKNNFIIIYSLFILLTIGIADIFRKGLFIFSVLVGIPVFLMNFLSQPVDFISKYGLDPDFVDNWPITKATKNQEIICSICCEKIKENDNIIQLKCSPYHCFHDNCLKPWLKRKISCPICRKVYLL